MWLMSGSKCVLLVSECVSHCCCGLNNLHVFVQRLQFSTSCCLCVYVYMYVWLLGLCLCYEKRRLRRCAEYFTTKSIAKLGEIVLSIRIRPHKRMCSCELNGSPLTLLLKLDHDLDVHLT